MSFAIYEIGWDGKDLRFKKLQIMAMQMTSQHLRLEAIPFFVLNHELFKSVSGWSTCLLIIIACIFNY